jgi:hypothetical protein
MTRFLSTTLATFAALALSLGSIGAIVTVPSAQAETPTVLALPAIA